MSNDACKDFLEVAEKFKLGTLSTETPHPRTQNLSQEIQADLTVAINSLKDVDKEAFEHFHEHIPKLERLGLDIEDTLSSGGRIYLCGCGATGRLSISLEVFCRQGMVPEVYQNRFVGFMAGGDAALIKSIENFEDFPDYGRRQLIELGFSKNDLLISTTEGGETPFVIGATEAASDIGDRKPWFLYCNPEEQLVETVERSRKVIENSGIQSLSLYVGPMGLSGSTRMQASTVLMAAVGWAIQHGKNSPAIKGRLAKLETVWRELDLSKLEVFIREEADAYKKSEYVIYETEDFAVTVLTDTTERSPTFSLPPFENESDPDDSTAWCYLSIPTASNTTTAWSHILQRSPRCLEWDGIQSFAGESYLNGFYIDASCLEKRLGKTNGRKHHPFSIRAMEDGLQLTFKGYAWLVPTPDLDLFERNLLLKLILNIHSTILMGELGRFESNLMTFVKPTNYKLIDRTIRYVQRLMELRGMRPRSYNHVARQLFEKKGSLRSDEPIVIVLLEALDRTAKD